jgi:hypothetical protein
VFCRVGAEEEVAAAVEQKGTRRSETRSRHVPVRRRRSIRSSGDSGHVAGSHVRAGREWRGAVQRWRRPRDGLHVDRAPRDRCRWTHRAAKTTSSRRGS